MIITISGAACTGKTTLLSEIKHDKYVNGNEIICHEEFIRTVFSFHYSSKYKDFADLLQGDPYDIINIHKETARRFNEILWSSNLSNPHTILIFDRSPLDIGIYMYMNIAEYLAKGDKDLLYAYRTAASYVTRCSDDFLNHNPVMFYARPFQEEIVDDGFRPMSLIRRRELEISLFDKEFLSLPQVRVLPTKFEDRVWRVQRVIEEQK